MRQDRRLMKQCFGTNEWNFADLPGKISNVRLARLFHLFLGRRYSLIYESEIPNRKNKKLNCPWRFYRHRQDN